MNKLLLTVVLSLISGFCFGWEDETTTKITEISCKANEEALCIAYTKIACRFTWKGNENNGQSILFILITAQSSDRTVVFNSKKPCFKSRTKYSRVQELELSSVRILKD
ncbi:MAG: hypothetical protein AAGH46_13440 [Bacteroidota bacterium]